MIALVWYGALPWLGWLVVFGGLEAWGLRRQGDAWPPLTEVVKTVMHKRTDPRWWVAFGLWLWAGVHFFLQGW